MATVALVRDSSYLEHDPGEGHPEKPDRLRVIYRAVDGLLEKTPEPFVEIPAREATREQLLRVHSAGHVESLEATAGESAFLDLDTRTSPGSYRAALRAAGGLCAAVDTVVRRQVSRAFALVRPPGHHAEKDTAMGFCLFNNVAVATDYARVELGLERVLIVDWDLHHGNGTQHIFEDRADVLYFSVHQYPYYPGTGGFEETGQGEGAGATINVPLMPGYVDEDYLALFREILVPVAGAFAPQLLLVSAGFDTHRNDPLGQMGMSESGYAALTRCLMDLADEVCGGALVLALEGGYDLEALEGSVDSVLRELAGLTVTRPPRDRGAVGPIIDRLKQLHAGAWPVLADR